MQMWKSKAIHRGQKCKKTWVATNAYRPKPRPSQAEGQGGEQQERDSTMKSRKAPKKFGKKHKEPGTLPAGFAEAMSLTEALSRSTQPDDDGYYDDVHKLLAAQAAHTILSGFHVGKVPIKVCWLSLVSNEPIGMFYSGAKDAYRGILIRYEAGTKGRRYCSFTPPHDGGISGAGFGAVPFEEKGTQHAFEQRGQSGRGPCRGSLKKYATGHRHPDT